VGNDLESAARTSKAAGLVATPVEVKKRPENVKPRVVFGQQPAEGTQVAAGASVEIYYSVGAPAAKTLKVPDLLRKTKQEAEKELAKMKLTAKATAGDRKPTRSNKRQEVYSQTPSAGTEVKEGEAVAFEYLAGIKVGRYNGMKKDAAFKAIEAAGFDAQVSEGDLVTKNISERSTVYDQSPKPDEYRWFGDVVKAWYYKSAEGFQKEDGALVDARFAEPTITDGDVPGIGGKAAGKLSAIYFFKSGGAKEKQTGIGWAIKRFENGSDARAFIAEKSKDGLFQMKNLSVGGTTIRANHQIAGDHANASSHVTTPQGQLSSHLNMVIYKDRFLIYFTHIVPDASHDFAKESSRIVQKSKEAIDARFPDD